MTNLSDFLKVKKVRCVSIGDSIIDLLEIDDYEPLSAYLSIYSFEVRGVSE